MRVNAIFLHNLYIITTNDVLHSYHSAVVVDISTLYNLGPLQCLVYIHDKVKRLLSNLKSIIPPFVN